MIDFDMRKILENPILSLIARLIVGWVFIYAAVGKIADPADFAGDIKNYQLLPDFLLNIAALTMPWIEMLCGIFLIVGFRLKANALISISLLIFFNVAVLFAMSQGLNIDCGCFSQRASMVGWEKVGENTISLIFAIYVFLFPVRTLTLERFALNDAKK
jgi:putative oxidoreductase